MSPSISPWGSPLGSPLGSPHVSPARSHMPQPHSSPRPPDLPSIAEVVGQGSRHAGRPARRENLRASGNHTAGPRTAARTAGVASEPGKTEGASRPGIKVANDVAVPQRGEARDAEAGDAYHSFRGEALQLTRRWQSAARKATSAFSGRGTAHKNTHVRASIAAGNLRKDPHKCKSLRGDAEGTTMRTEEPEMVLGSLDVYDVQEAVTLRRASLLGRRATCARRRSRRTSWRPPASRKPTMPARAMISGPWTCTACMALRPSQL